MSPFTGLIQNICLNESKFPQDLPIVKFVNKNKHSEYFSSSFWDSDFFWLKRELFSGLAQKSFKTRDKLSGIWLILSRKIFFLHLSSFTALNKKGCLQQILIFLLICSFSNLFRKTNFQSNFELLSKRVNFLTKKEFFSEFPQKCFITTGKQFGICPILVFDQKEWFSMN